GPSLAQRRELWSDGLRGVLAGGVAPAQVRSRDAGRSGTQSAAHGEAGSGAAAGRRRSAFAGVTRTRGPSTPETPAAVASTIRLTAPSVRTGKSSDTGGRAAAFAVLRLPTSRATASPSQRTGAWTAWGEPSSLTVRR